MDVAEKIALTLSLSLLLFSLSPSLSLIHQRIFILHSFSQRDSSSDRSIVIHFSAVINNRTHATFFWRFQFQCEAQALALSTSVVKIMRLQVNADSPNNMVTPKGLRDGEALSLRHQIFVT